MDGTVVQSASDQQLKDMGLALGDILALRAFCCSKFDSRSGTKTERETMKQRLLEKLFGKRPGDSEKLQVKKKRTVPGTSNSCKTVKVYLGWQHYMSDQGRFKQVRLSKGGGIREVFLPVSTSYVDLLKIATTTFFPKGVSHVGVASEMQLKLGNFQGENIREEEMPTFSLEMYREIYNLPRIKIYLLSEKKSK